jgi:hypothetical protein
MLAAYRVPAAAKAAWGRRAEDLDDATWELLDDAELAPPLNVDQAGIGLGMLLKMTRLHDLGLAQLCVPELVADDGSKIRRTHEGEAVTCARTTATAVSPSMYHNIPTYTRSI